MQEGVKVDDSKAAAVQSVPLPKTVKEVSRFFGMTAWYQLFIPNYVESRCTS